MNKLKELVKRLEDDEYITPTDVVEAVDKITYFNIPYTSEKKDWEKLKKKLGVE